MEQTFPLEMFGKKGQPSEVFLFSRFGQNHRNILYHLLRPTNATLLGELMARFWVAKNVCHCKSLVASRLKKGRK